VGKDAIIDGGDAWYTGMTILAGVLETGILCPGTLGPVLMASASGPSKWVMVSHASAYASSE
jgi:hypothetical protein